MPADNFPSAPDAYLSDVQSGFAIQDIFLMAFTVTRSAPPEPEVPRLDAPVTLHFSESLTGVFADPSIDMSFFQMVDLPVGGRYGIGDQLGPDDWYQFAIRDKSVQGGLVSYTGETLMTKLGRLRPRESLILVAGQGVVPAQLDLRECLRRFLIFYGVPFVDDLPGFYLRAGDELVTPAVQAFVIRPNQESPESLYEWLERFFAPFRGYTFRANEDDVLIVTPPAWVDTLGLRLVVYRRRQPLDRTPLRDTVRAPWSTTRAPRVEWVGDVNGTPVSGTLPDPLTLNGLEVVTVEGVDVRVTWDPGFVQVQVWPIPDSDVSTGDLYHVAFIFRPDGGGQEVLELTDGDLGQGEVLTSSADTVINQVVLPVRRREFTPDQNVMQAAAMVVTSPQQLMAGPFGNNPAYGPMAEALATPNGFLELVNDTVQAGTWFWPADDTVVAQPGGVITVAFDVEEWAEQWRAPGGGPPYAPAANVNTFDGTATLPTSGVEVKLFDFQFPRQTSDFAPSPYGAQGSVFGRWRAGEQPGIELRLGNSRFAEFGFLWEGLGGQTVYFLWGAIVKLNGTGMAFTEGVLETYRFGWVQEGELWEGGANVPGLAESQAFFPDRVYHAPEVPYTISPETALAVARGIVEENLTPKTIYRLPIVPSTPDGWIIRPYHLGRAARVTATNLTAEGRVTTVEYNEAHTPMGSTSEAFVEIEALANPDGSRVNTSSYEDAAYGVSHYQEED